MTVHHQRFLLEEGNPLPSGYDVVYCCQCGFFFADDDCGQDTYDRYNRSFSKYEDENTGADGGDTWFEQERLPETCRRATMSTVSWAG
ncbi:MAG TPA: hypothetical protein VN371_04525 [Chlorobaculum sp.]|nr:hypothetical protein [Chlorobaculum sp.]